jgi:Rieske 2Fe-2S family protein
MARNDLLDRTSPETQAFMKDAKHAPGFMYTSPEVLAYEKENIFLKDWLCVGREEEIEKPGDYMALRILDEPIVIVRTQNNEVKAFSNICLHRGAELVKGCGNTRRLNCPFHAWSYDLNGQLAVAPHMQCVEGFDVSTHRLPALRVGVWVGWIFVSFNENAPPLSDHVAVLERDFGFLRQEDCRLAIKTVNEVNCNWKLVCENLIDYYHLPVVHKKTNGRQLTLDAVTIEPRDRGGYLTTFNSGPSTISGKPAFGRMPWLADKPDNFSTGGRLWPNLAVFARIDTVHPSTIWPISAGRTQKISYTLIPKVYFDEPNFKERVQTYQDYLNTVFDEDRVMLESVQNGLGSQRFQPGHMSALEGGVQHVVNAFIESLKGMGEFSRMR